MSVPASSTATSPLALLREIDARSRRHAMGLPQQVEVRRTWSGIGFRIDGKSLVTSLGEVREILHYPSLTRVPGAKSWVRGIANVRGNLLPIMDMKGFLEGAATEIGRQTRVLVIREGGMAAGLLVDEVLGLRHFFDEEATEGPPACSEAMAAHLSGGYRQADVHWGLFSMQALADNPQFMEVAARGQA